MGDEPNEGRAAAFNHVGICVSDLDRSQHFYERVLGFRHWWEMDVPDAGCSRLLQLAEPVGAKAVYLVNGSVVIELLYFAGAGIHASPRRVMNDLGLTHLSVAVEDIGTTLAKVGSHGGEILQDTDMGGLAIMIRDPDGQLIELTTFGFPDMRPPWPDPATPA